MFARCATLALLLVPLADGALAADPRSVGPRQDTPAATASEQGAGEPAAPADAAEAAFRFALAKVLTEEGSLGAAAEAFAEAARRAPEDPYIRTEHAELLRRLAARSRRPIERGELLEQAVAEVEAAAALAPDNPDVLRALAQIHLALADSRPQSLAAAIAALEKIRTIAPWDLQTMIPLGQIYAQQGDPGRAAEVFAEAADYTPDSHIVYSMLAEALRAAGRDAAAVVALEHLITLDPMAVEARVTLARLYARRGDAARAVEVLTTAPPGVRDSAEITGELAWLLYRGSDYEAALEAAEASLAADPANRWLRLVHALVLGGLGRTDEALDGIAELRRDDPDNLELVRAAAGLLEGDGFFEEAADLYRELLERLGDDHARRPEIDRTRLMLAGVQARAGETAAALAVLEEVLESPETEVRRDAAIAYADLLHEAGRADEALAVLRRGDAPELRVKEMDLLLADGERGKARKLARRLLADGSTEMQLLAAQAAQQREEYELSIPLLERVLEATPEERSARFLLGAGLERTGRHAEAAAAFETLLAAVPDFAPALNYLGYMWAERGENLDRALELVERAVALDPDNGAYIDSLGWAHYQRGDYDRARDYLERAADLIPDDATIWEHLADVYAALGEVEKARELYRRALAAGGDDPTELQRKLDGLSLRQ